MPTSIGEGGHEATQGLLESLIILSAAPHESWVEDFNFKVASDPFASICIPEGVKLIVMRPYVEGASWS